MKIDFDEVFRKLDGISNAIYVDKDRLKRLLVSARKKVKGNKQLSDIWEDLKVLFELIKDWIKGDYKDLSKSSVLLVIGSLIYLVSPIDLIPDFLIGGFIDDIAVLGYVIKKISQELIIYKDWKDIKNDGIIFEAEEDDFINKEDEDGFSI